MKSRVRCGASPAEASSVRALLALEARAGRERPGCWGLYGVADEVDAGVGGAIAEWSSVIAIAEDVALHRQVLCVDAPRAEIAALADAHFVVDKVERDDRIDTPPPCAGWRAASASTSWRG